MNRTAQKYRVLSAAASLALGVCSAFGQTAPAAPTTGTQDEAVKLDPFQVSADSDVGFVAAASLAGGRIATALKDTPVAYSVVTKEFLEAFSITDTAAAVEWTPSGANNNADNAGTGSSPNMAHRVTIRGVRTGTPLRNYFQFFGTPDSYSLDRVDLGRGPNAVLYGAGGQAGTQNSITKQALFNRTIRDVTLRYGSFDRFRFTTDVNQPITNTLAVRANLMWDQGHTWKDSEYDLKKGAQFTVGYQVTPKFTVRGEVEFLKSERLVMTQMKDQTSAWDGKTFLATTLPLTGAGAPTASQLAQMGLVRLNENRFVIYPDAAWDGGALNFRNEFRTKGAGHSTTAANTNYINGTPIRTVGYNLNNQSVVDLQGIDPNVRWANAFASPFFTVPRRNENNLWDNKYPTWNETDLSQTISFNYRVTDNLFVELAGNINRSDYTARQTNRRGLNEQRIDVARILPNGNPNPFFLHSYSEHMDYNNDRRNTYENARAQVGYTKDSRFGKLQLAVLGGMTNHELIQRGSSLLLPLTSLAPDARTWVDNLELSEYGLYSRRYFDQPSPEYWPETEKMKPVKVINPINGITEVVTPKRMFDTRREDNNVNSLRKYQFVQMAGNLDLFKNRLVLIGAFRRDVASLKADRVLQPGSYAPGWDGTTIQFRQAPPADYYELMYTPKNAAGQPIGSPLVAETRPRVAVNNAQVPAPQYLNDRFRDDFNSPIARPAVNTSTYGAVINVTRNIGIYANIGETYEISEAKERLDGTLALPTASKGKDAGVRFTLPNGRLSVSLGWYSSYQAGNQVGPPIGGAVNTFAATPVVGDLSSTGQNARGQKAFPQNAIIDTNTVSADGYELDFTANLTPNWRLVMNASKNKSLLKDQFPDSLGYFQSHESVFRQILSDAGILIDAQNNATINPALDDPTKINQTKVLAAVNAWNNLIDNTIPNITNQFQQQRQGVVPWIANLATDYRFRNGPVRGLRVGLGVQYRSGMIVGYRGNDTIIDPNNPNAAIDDPSVDATTLVTANANYKVTGTLSYTYRFKESTSRIAPKTVQFDLNIDNLLNNREPNYGYSNDSATTAYTFNSPRNGDWTQPARVTLPGTPSYFIPRNFLLTAKVSF